MSTTSFRDAWSLMFEEHPSMKQKLPFADVFLNHRGQVDYFDGQFAQLIDKEDPKLPIGTLLVMNDFSESPVFQHVHKTGDFIYSQQSILLGPTPCLFTVPDEEKGHRIILIELNFLADDPYHSSPRVLQIFANAIEFMRNYMLQHHGLKQTWKNRVTLIFF